MNADFGYFAFGRDNMDALMHRIEWATLLFFAAMFVTLECLDRLRLIQWIGEQTMNIILLATNEKSQLTIAILVVLWVKLHERKAINIINRHSEILK